MIDPIKYQVNVLPDPVIPGDKKTYITAKRTGYETKDTLGPAPQEYAPAKLYEYSKRIASVLSDIAPKAEDLLHIAQGRRNTEILKASFPLLLRV